MTGPEPRGGVEPVTAQEVGSASLDAPEPLAAAGPLGGPEPVDAPIAGQLGGGFLAMTGGLAALIVVGIAPVSDALANLLALGAVIVMALGVWSFWVALRTIGARSDRAAGHVPRDVWWSRL